MGKKQSVIKPESGKRLSDWLSEIGMTQNELSVLIGYTQQYISNIITGKKPMVLPVAEAVAEKTNAGKSMRYNLDIKIRPAYLLCLDDIRTNEDFERQYIDRQQNINSAALTLLDFALKEVSLIEGEKTPDISIPEAVVLQQLVLEQTINTVWSFVKNREHSPFWTLIDGKQFPV